MKAPTSVAKHQESESRFGQIFEEITDRLLIDPSADLESLVDQHPEFADQLRQLLPAVQVLARARPTENHLAQVVPHATSTGEPRPGVLGDYRIIREIGRGGMGVVYEAEQLSLSRRVALKVLPFAAMLDKRHLQRFRNEAKAAAGLHHTNIVPVYSVGCERGVHFFAMQFIEGASLAALIEQMHQSDQARRTAVKTKTGSEGSVLSTADTEQETQALLTTKRDATRQGQFRTVAELGIQTAEALEHAHFHGVVHRDIKPANLILDEDGVLWITDFGLARLESDVGVTMSGDLLGTLRYMSPEQASGAAAVLDCRTDIYSLGVTLYELLTLRPAFGAENRQKLLKQIAEEEPPSPRQLDRETPIDLETIVLKAMAKEPADRYGSAQELARDLGRFLHHKPIHARRASLANRISKWSRRRSELLVGMASIMSIALVFLVVGIAAMVRQNATIQTAFRRSEQNLHLARRTVDEMYDRVARDWIADDRSLSPVQQELLMSALHTYEQLATETGTRPATRHEAAAACRRAADIRNRLGQYDLARAGYEKGMAIQLQLVRDAPDSPQYRSELWITHLHYGNLLLSTGQLAEAREKYEAARKQVARLARDDPSDSKHERGIQACHINIAAVLQAQGSFKDAEAVIRQSRKDFDYFRSDPRAAYRARWIMASGILATVLREQNRLNEAEAICRDILPESSRLTLEMGDVREYCRLAAGINSELGRALAASERLKEAADQFRNSLELQQKALPFGMTPREYCFAVMGKEVEDRVHEPEAFCDYANTQCYLGMVLRRLGEPEEAGRLFDEAERTCRVWVILFPHVLRYRFSQAFALHLLGSLRTEIQPKQAREPLDKAVTICRELRQSAPHVWEYRDQLSQSLCEIAWLLSYERDDSVFDPVAAVRLAQEAVEVTPEQREYWTALGAAHCRAGNADKAIEAIVRSTALGDEESAADGLILAMAHSQAGQREEAGTDYRRAEGYMKRAGRHATPARIEHLRSEAARMLQIGETSDVGLEQPSH